MRIGTAWCAAALLTLSGCGRKAVEVPGYSPGASAAEAVRTFDKNFDRQIAGDELAACPGVRAALKFADKDQSGGLSEAELTARIQNYVDTDRGLFPVTCVVTIDGEPAADCQVKLVPEPFLHSLKPAQGVTNASGLVFFQVEGQEFTGAQLGMYRVEITSAATPLPEKYNTKTELGLEVAMGSRELESAIALELEVDPKAKKKQKSP